MARAGEEAERPPKANPKAEPAWSLLRDKPGRPEFALFGRLWRDRSDETFLSTMLGNRIWARTSSSGEPNLRGTTAFPTGAGSVFRFRRSGSVLGRRTQVRTDATGPGFERSQRRRDLLGQEAVTLEETNIGDRPEAKS